MSYSMWVVASGQVATLLLQAGNYYNITTLLLHTKL